VGAAGRVEKEAKGEFGRYLRIKCCRMKSAWTRKGFPDDDRRTPTRSCSTSTTWPPTGTCWDPAEKL